MPTDDISWALATRAAHTDRYRLYQRYYDGDHRLLFATEKYRNAFGSLFRAFADNLCGRVVDTIADRIRLERLSVAGDGDEPALEEALADLWRRNRLRRWSGTTTTGTLRDGDGYLIVWPDTLTGRPRIWPNSADLVTVDYDPDDQGRIVRAVKIWRVVAGHDRWRWRATVYLPDRIERYATADRTVGTAPADGTPFVPLPDYPVVGNDTGRVPVFHIDNDARSPGGLGRSELGPVIPLQDALNKAVCDLLIAMEFHAFPQRWATGVQAAIDPDTGAEVPFDAGADRLWWTGSKDATFGQFAIADLGGYLDVHAAFRAEIARVAGVPTYSFRDEAGGWPSGESLKVADASLVAKAEDRQDGQGETWAEVGEYALMLDPRFGRAVDGVEITPIWAPAALRSETTQVATQAAKLEAGLSRRQALREWSYTDAEIDKFEKERELEPDELGTAVGALLDRGRGV